MEGPPQSETATVQRKWRRDFRSWGRHRFILRFGVIGFGGWMFIAMTASDIWFHHRIDYVDALLNLVIWPLVGHGFGRALWSLYYDPEDNGK